MLEWFKEVHPVLQALLATSFTWGVTALGASLVFFFKKIDKKSFRWNARFCCWCNDCS